MLYGVCGLPFPYSIVIYSLLPSWEAFGVDSAETYWDYLAVLKANYLSFWRPSSGISIYNVFRPLTITLGFLLY